MTGTWSAAWEGVQWWCGEHSLAVFGNRESLQGETDHFRHLFLHFGEIDSRLMRSYLPKLPQNAVSAVLCDSKSGGTFRALGCTPGL